MGLIFQATSKLDGRAYIGRSATTLERARRSVEAAATRGVVQTPLCAAIRAHGGSQPGVERLGGV